jgi:hypothetical protein
VSSRGTATSATHDGAAHDPSSDQNRASMTPGPLVRSARAHRPDEPGTSLVLLRRAVPAQAEPAAGQPAVPLADERAGRPARGPQRAP